MINESGRKLSRMASPATPKEVNNNLDEENNNDDEGEAKLDVIICEIAPKISYAGEGLEPFCKGERIKIPALRIGEPEDN